MMRRPRRRIGSIPRDKPSRFKGRFAPGECHGPSRTARSFDDHAAGLVGATGRVGGADHEVHHDEVQESCLKNCQACKRQCDQAFHHCLGKLAKGEKGYAKASQLVADCAAFCDLSATLIARRSPLMLHACAACAVACQDCGAECDKFNDPELKDCPMSCHDCEATCRLMVKSLGGHHR